MGRVGKVSSGCIGCGTCVSVCPKKAIKISKKTNRAEIDTNKCIGCGRCEDACPVSAIILEEKK
ncbi:MAG: 4Fe-4S binding protein [Mycoplasmataceae bacterium]|jgi:formate hydrogenlyase subunit 6/NADH:ubiquinone oxidoreductase subunit I|nr:4Fe-4S binding protein [Mycoplasmataceae bacterium]